MDMDGTAVTQSHVSDSVEAESAVVRFAGDSGDGMQLTGGRFTLATAQAGNDLATFPDFPAEIRAPVGTTFGVSAFQINFGGREIKTVGDQLDVLVAMNPAALKVNLGDVQEERPDHRRQRHLYEKNLRKAGYESNPLEDASLEDYKLLPVDMSKLTLEAAKPFGVSNKEGLRTKNLWALGLVYWMYGRDRQSTHRWLQQKFAKRPEIVDANIAALDAGHAFGETVEQHAEIKQVHVPQAKIQPGQYRAVTGAQAMAWGLASAAKLSGQRMVFCSYPITPASSLLHNLAGLKSFNVETFQAEDEIAAVCAAIGASYAGTIGVTSSSGPGVALKTEALGLAISAELPLVVVNSQRGGPSTGLPTKTEQSDLFQAVWGRNGDAPLCVLATRSPSDCFETAIEAVRIATKFMVPVIVLTDGFLANASEPWRIPDAETFASFEPAFASDPETFQPFARDPETLARPWAKPGTPGLEHRIGGIEKQQGSGNISYDPQNHHTMTLQRAEKVQRIAQDVPPNRPSIWALTRAGLRSSVGARPMGRSAVRLPSRGLTVSMSAISICAISGRCPGT